METYRQASRQRSRDRAELGERIWDDQWDEFVRPDDVVRQRALEALRRERFGDPSTIDAERFGRVTR